MTIIIRDDDWKWTVEFRDYDSTVYMNCREKELYLHRNFDREIRSKPTCPEDFARLWMIYEVVVTQSEHEHVE